MHGGMKVYTGAPAAARHYVEAGRGRADDYYLAEGTGIARRYAAGAGRVREVAPLSGDGYEGWVAGVDPVTGDLRGRLRTNDRAVRFVEVLVNGPKSWSLAAALHPDIAAAYDAAQDRAAEQIIAWPGARDHAGRSAWGAGAGAGGGTGGGDGAALHLPGRGSAPPSAPADSVSGVRGRKMARAAHRRHSRLPVGYQWDRARRDGV